MRLRFAPSDSCSGILQRLVARGASARFPSSHRDDAPQPRAGRLAELEAHR